MLARSSVISPGEDPTPGTLGPPTSCAGAVPSPAHDRCGVRRPGSRRRTIDVRRAQDWRLHRAVTTDRREESGCPRFDRRAKHYRPARKGERRGGRVANVEAHITGTVWKIE